MLKKMMKQTGVLMLFALAMFVSKNSHIDTLERGADAILGHMETGYTAEDVSTVAGRSRELAASVTSKVGDAVAVIAGRPSYGEPIDKEYEGTQTAVYAVGGGEVTAVGENEEIGKYIKITHGNDGESLYGNLKLVNVSVPTKVKKSQIIGVYEKTEGKDFYYSFREFDK